MAEIKDRLVQYPNRYKLTDAGTGEELGTYDFTEEPGTVEQEGTVVDAELLSSIGAMNLNGEDVNNPSFYAPTTYGEAGQVLVSQGAGAAPIWDAPSGKDIVNATVTLGEQLTFNGSAQEKAITSVVLDGVSLNEGTDYKVSGNIATDAGNYTMAIMGIGEYSGTLCVDWTIDRAQGSISVSETSVTILGAAGETKQIPVNITSGYGDLVATSSDPNIATVSMLGDTPVITSVTDGYATITVRLIGNYTAEINISVRSLIVSTVLNDSSWETIRFAADNDLGDSFWAVGDTKAITLNGTIGTQSYSNVTLWAYILGFNHNASIEGEHLIHFGCFKSAQTGGVDICLDDSHYNSTSTSGGKWFNMNHFGNLNHGGWSRCDMRYDILGSTNVEPDGYGASPSAGQKGHDPTSTCATSPVADTLMAAFPADLRAVMKPATKYTDNLGENQSSSAVTATHDYLPLLAEFEAKGAITDANTYEKNYQEKYAYYENGNNRIKYRQLSIESAANWWLRSPMADNNHRFCRGAPRFDSVGYGNVSNSYGVSPVFFI